MQPRTLLVTTLRVERNEIRTHLQREGLRVEVSGGVDYDVGSFVAGETTWDVGVAELGQDNIDAATEIERAVRWFSPDLVLFVGIAHPVNTTAPGDVVAGRYIEGYERDLEPPGFLRRGRVQLGMPRLLHIAGIVEQSSWFDRVRSAVSGGRARRASLRGAWYTHRSHRCRAEIAEQPTAKAPDLP